MSLARELMRLADRVDQLETEERPEVVGIAEIAALAEVTQNTAASWRKRNRLPAPLAELRQGPVWLKADIEAWLAGRP